jgi:bifunctional DNase/RNase
MSQHRVVVLKDVDSDRYLPIWIGPFEADAITIQLQGVQVARPLTHDLLKSIIDEMGARISHVMVSELKNDTFYARIVMDVNGGRMEIDARPSDAIALAVRANAPLFVAEEVMAAASITPETSLDETRPKARRPELYPRKKNNNSLFSVILSRSLIWTTSVKIKQGTALTWIKRAGAGREDP